MKANREQSPILDPEMEDLVNSRAKKYSPDNNNCEDWDSTMEEYWEERSCKPFDKWLIDRS